MATIITLFSGYVSLQVYILLSSRQEEPVWILAQSVMLPLARDAGVLISDAFNRRIDSNLLHLWVT